MSTAIKNKNSPLENCWGFIDRTMRPKCRPAHHQRIVYNGHKRVHGLKFQSIMAPNGTIAHFYGPVEETRHDPGLLRESGVEIDIHRHMTTPNNEVYCLYGDPAYPLTQYIISHLKVQFYQLTKRE